MEEFECHPSTSKPKSPVQPIYIKEVGKESPPSASGSAQEIPAASAEGIVSSEPSAGGKIPDLTSVAADTNGSGSVENPPDRSTSDTISKSTESEKSPSITKTPSKSGEGLQASASASSGPEKIQPQGGADGSGMSMMAKMMAMMAKGMPNMSAMMGKMGGKGGGMEMMDLMDCIIQVSLLKPDSDVSDDDDDSITVELPCPYCSRFFSSNVSLKTHILVAHDREDTSLLNLRRLSIEKGKRSPKDVPSKQKHSWNSDKIVVGAASTVTKPSEDSPSASPAEDHLIAAEPMMKGIKRTREGKKGDADTSGAAGDEESILGELRSRLRSGAAPSGCVAGSPPESGKRKALLQKQRSASGDSAVIASTAKKSKAVREKSVDHESISEKESQSEEKARVPKTMDDGDREQSNSSKDSPKEASRHTRHKKIKATAKGPETVQKESKAAAKDRDISSDADCEISDKGIGRRSLRSSRAVKTASAVASASVDEDLTLVSRRSLRSREVH